MRSPDNAATMPPSQSFVPRALDLKVGDWVEIRTETEILATLDERGTLDHLPVMPQMLDLCGRRFRVSKRAHKLCDTATDTGARTMSDAVFLDDVRCDGEAYGGCEMRCRIVWKEAWLRRADGETKDSAVPSPVADGAGDVPPRCTRLAIASGTRRASTDDESTDPTYVCQATEMPRATLFLSRWSPGQYVEDYRSGNATIGGILSGLIYIAYENMTNSGLGFGSAMRWLYDTFQAIRGGTPYPARLGHIKKGGRTPAVDLGLQVGDLVRVRSHEEILRTVDEELRNRGMSFHPTMVPYCGKEYRVLQRARRIMNERTGKLMELKNECLVLDGADCVGRYTNPLSCPRACYPYWREIWLERIDRPSSDGQGVRPT